MSPARSAADRAPRATGLRLLASLAFGLAVLATPGCGAGGALDDALGNGGGNDTPPAQVSIRTTALPSAGLNVPYSTTLAADGGSAPYAWQLAPNATLPPGLSLASGGSIFGTATQLGSYTFGVVVTDAGGGSDSATYSLLVSAFDASIAQLHVGDAWTGESYPVSAVGGPGTTFTIVQNQSGGSITAANPSTSTATWRAGPTPGTDRIRATGTGGDTKDLVVEVRPNPVGQMTSSFASTDVWHLRFDGKFDATHPFASDWLAALATIGMRAATSTGVLGTDADGLADLYVRQQVLRHLNGLFLNNGDGSPRLDGLDASFPFVEPAAPHFSPADGAVANPATNQFNVLTVSGGGSGGVVGTAFLDDPDNGYQENNTTTTGDGELGVFVDELAPIFNSAYSNNTLRVTPVGAGDIEALKALLYGLAKPAGSRYDELARIAEGFGRTVAAVAAHEVGHSLGLVHTSPAVAGSIMNAGATISPGASYTFTATDLTSLRGALPGPGRGGSGQRVDALRVAGPDEGSVDVGIRMPCKCHLHVTQSPSR